MGTLRLGWPTWIGVVADDFESQRQFYSEVLGLRETASGDGWVNFEVDGHAFEVIQRDAQPQYERRRYQAGFTVDDIESARDELVASGVEQISGIEGGPESANRWCYFRDPEGNVFEITQWLDDR